MCFLVYWFFLALIVIASKLSGVTVDVWEKDVWNFQAKSQQRTRQEKAHKPKLFSPSDLGRPQVLSKTKTPQTVTLQVTILCQQMSKKKQHAPEHSFALTLRRSFVTIFWQKNLTKLQLAVLPFAVF